MNMEGPLIDRFGRVHNNLRVSVTDRCNIRCFYCTSQENVRFTPRSEILRFEEIERFVRVVVRLGVNRLRITGGEPLMRAELPTLVRQLANIPGVDDLAMTTNGLLLAEQAAALRAAGLRRLNISLDALRDETFRRIARRDGLARVLAGIEAAQQVGFEKIRLNTVAIRGITEQEIIALAEFARTHAMELRFIEFMPLDAEGNWHSQHVLPGAQIRAQLEQRYGPLVPVTRADPSQPAMDYACGDGGGCIGFINPVTEPFCGDCSRLRITAEGQVRNCLFSPVEWDARAMLRNEATDEQLADLVRQCVGAKKTGHGMDSPEFCRPPRAMYELGG
jgi:cyclic pyranopterin phosphate synthase